MRIWAHTGNVRANRADNGTRPVVIVQDGADLRSRREVNPFALAIDGREVLRVCYDRNAGHLWIETPEGATMQEVA